MWWLEVAFDLFLVVFFAWQFVAGCCWCWRQFRDRVG